MRSGWWTWLIQSKTAQCLPKRCGKQRSSPSVKLPHCSWPSSSHRKPLCGPPQLKAVVELASRDPSAEVLSSVVRLLSKWSREQPPRQRDELDRAVAELQGASGALLRWKTTGAIRADAAAALVEQFALPGGN